MNIRVTALIAASCITGWATANAQVESITYDQNRVFYGSYYQGADVANEEADNFFIRDRYTAADARWQRGYDPEPVNLGPFEVSPSLELGLANSSNLFLIDESQPGSPPEVDDSNIRVVGQASAQTTSSRHMFGFDAIVENESYFDTSSEDATEYGVRGFGQLDLGSSFAIAGSVAYRDAREDRTNIGSNISAAERISFQKTGAEVNSAYEFNRVRLRLRGSTATYDFDDVRFTDGTSVNLDVRNFDENRVAASAEYAMSRDWAIVGELERVERSYDQLTANGINRDTTGDIIRIGTNFELPANLRGEVSAGYLSFEPDDPTLQTEDGLALYADVQWFPTELTTVSTFAGRDVADAGGVESPNVLVTQYGIGVAHELMRNVVLSGDVTFEEREFPAVPLVRPERTDEQVGYGFGATWKVNRNMHLLGGYQYTDRDSNFEPFDESRIFITLRLFP
ncbi:MAG: outer membrane beta-barrel protein [Pseudomonadota bacterium]